MNRNKVEDIILEIGIPANTKGFGYIVDAMDIFEEKGHQIPITKILYPEIAKRNNTAPQIVERGIRYAFAIAKNARDDYEGFKKYIGFANTTNSAILISLYKHIKRENEEEARKSGGLKNLSPEAIDEIRKIVREELKRIVSG